MARGVKFVPADVQAIIRAYQEGQTADQIAPWCGGSRDTVYRLLKAEGVSLREGGRPKKRVEPEEVARLYRDGWTVTELAQIFGCYRSTIDHRLMLAGVKPRPQPGGTARSADKPDRAEAAPPAAGGRRAVATAVRPSPARLLSQRS